MLPKATHTLRNRPRRFVRRIGVPAKRDLKPASSSYSNSIKSGAARSGHACSFINLPSRANRLKVEFVYKTLSHMRQSFVMPIKG
jgi:hypothetical protein